jgi:hypothetical protein
MNMSAEEVKQFWRDFAARRKLPRDVVERGEKKIDEDPDYWADHTMIELQDLIAPKRQP